LAAFFGDEDAFLLLAVDFGLAELAFFVVAFLLPAALGFLATAAFFTLGVAAVVAAGAATAGLLIATTFFIGLAEAIFFPATGLAVVAFVFGLTCRGFLVALFALVELADLIVELDRGLAAFDVFVFFGLAAAVALVLFAADVEPPIVARFFADFGPADFDAARFFVPDADEATVELDELFFALVDDDDFLTLVDSPLGPSLNDPLAPLPLVCLKYFDFTPFLSAILRC